MVDAYDFDGTLIRDDSIKLFSKWVCDSKIEFFYLYYSFFFSFRTLTKLKFARVRFFLNLMKIKGKKINDFHNVLNKSLYGDSLNILQRDGVLKIVISASFDEIIGSYCREVLGVKVIANQLSRIDLDVNYDYKVIVLKKEFGESIVVRKAYGNSIGDFDLLKKAELGFFRTKEGKINRWVDIINK
jgi:phosphoserine phosphatase